MPLIDDEDLFVPGEYLPESNAVPLRYPKLKETSELVYVTVDVRGGHDLPKDDRYVETVPVDATDGPVKLLAEGGWRAPKHEFRRNQNTGFVQNNANLKTNGIGDPFNKRWLCMSSTEKEVWLHVIARANWWKRGALPQGHPEYRDRSFAGGPPPDALEDEQGSGAGKAYGGTFERSTEGALAVGGEPEDPKTAPKEAIVPHHEPKGQSWETEGPSERQLRLMCGQPRQRLKQSMGGKK